MTDLFSIDATALTAILLMALATYATRAGGFVLMSYVAIRPRIERFLRHSAGGVLIAIVAGGAGKGDLAFWIGLGVVIAVMLGSKKAMAAMLAGVAAAAALRAFT